VFRTLVLAIAGLPACHSATAPAPVEDTPAARPRDLPTFKRNPETRDHVKKQAVAEYKVKTDNKLNDLYFSVKLFETPETMKYIARFDYEGLGGEDTIRLPDVGVPPHPVLQKGPEKYSCIIGLMDNTNTFRELKKIYVTDKGSQLKVTTLKHYVVTEGYRLVTE